MEGGSVPIYTVARLCRRGKDQQFRSGKVSKLEWISACENWGKMKEVDRRFADVRSEVGDFTLTQMSLMEGKSDTLEIELFSLQSPPHTTHTTTMVAADSRIVSIAPLVLLSVVDHYERIVRSSESSVVSSNKRVVGVILGSHTDNEIRISNSFAIPYEEDESNSNIWFLDHNYIDSMMEMFKKINAKEKLIGWYHSGPKLKQNDLRINEVFKTFTPNPLLLIVDVNSTDKIDIPTDCYMAIEEIKEDGSANEKTFLHYPSIIEAEEAEEIGVEHLLRDIRDENRGNLTIALSNNFKSLKSLNERISNIVKYLCKLITGELPINSTILGKLQDIFNLLPNISQITYVQSGNPNQVDAQIYSHEKRLATAFNIKTNDELMILYVSSLVRSIIAFHDLIDNKIENRKKNSDSQAETDDTAEDKSAADADAAAATTASDKESSSKK